jgi:protein phosphatase
VSEETLAEALQDPDPQSTADRLIELALRSGGPDNITVIVADVVDDGGRGPALIDPVIDGAAGGNVGQRQVDARSAAGRAALADPPPPSPPPTPPTGGGPTARRRPLRLILVAVAVLVLLVAGAIGTYAWALQHWFVGVEGTGAQERVAVFRGLEVSLLGLDLFEVSEVTELPVADLNTAARNRVRGGITADDSADATRILDALHGQRLPPCRTGTGDGAEKPGNGTPAESEASATTDAPPDPGAATTTPGSTVDPTTSTSSTPARTTSSSSEPGVTCRESE